MYAQRRKMLQDWETTRGCRALLYVTGDRPGMEAQVHPDVLDHLALHLDAIADADTLALFLYTRGGSTLAAWSVVNLLRQFCRRLEVVVPAKAHSAGTLMCLGADSIMMTKQATLGPIDPSVNGPLNPAIPGAPPQVRAPVSVEAINGFLEFAKKEAGLKGHDLAEVLMKLAAEVHPLVLGDVYRSRSQIRMLARRLLTRQLAKPRQVERILDFLCSESGSHDYTIYRKEARDELGLQVEKPDDALYAKIKAIYDDFAGEMVLRSPFSPESILGKANQVQYSFCRALVESVPAGSTAFVSEGELTRQQVQVPPGITQVAVHDRRTFEGWRHTNA